ncbi:MAG: protein kinase [Bryobacteraceae bacterium]|nr:protein kinase [Bryobacteraceae bacterium]
MNSEEWEATKQIFDEALDLPAPDRAEFVLTRCANEPVVRDAVLELIQHHREDASAPLRVPARTPVLSEGQIIAGRFRIERLIAAGGMGEVYAAWDEWLRLRIALKTLRSDSMGDADALDRFKRELLVARQVAHENLVRVFDFVEHRRPDGQMTPCFTMELLEGESLADLLLRKRPLGIEEALPIIRQVASGLQILHEHNIVHRDLKPSNIMITAGDIGQPRAVVTDFGLARRDGTESERFDSEPESTVGGAPYFMAPELLENQRPSTATDIYAFGLVVDEMVTSTRAFSSRSLQALCYEKLWETPASPMQRSTDLPEHWSEAILRCVEVKPEARFGSVFDAMQALESPALEVVAKGDEKVAERQGLSRWFPALARRVMVAALITIPLAGGAATLASVVLQPVTASVEVFEITNQTGEQELDYLCKGTTQELMRRLLTVRGVKVFSPHTTRAGAPARRSGRFSLDGTLQAHNGQIRLTMQLSDNEQKGDLLWSDNFDRQGIQNPLELQTDIAANTVASVEQRVLLGKLNDRTPPYLIQAAALRLRQWLAPQTAAVMAGAPTTSNEAFEAYLRGHKLLEELSPMSASAAIEYFRKAISEDPRFALAHAAAADAHMALMNYNYRPHAQLADQARTYAAQAVQLDPGLAEAHLVLAAVRQMDWDWQGAEAAYKEALRLKPNMAKARRWYAGLLAQFGRWNEALPEAARAMELDPYDRAGAPSAGLYLFLAGRHQESVEMLRTAVISKDTLLARHNLGQVYAWLGHSSSAGEASGYYRLALEQAERILAMERDASAEGRTSFADQLYALIYALKGDAEATRVHLMKLESDMQQGGTSPVTIAWIYAIEGRTEEACTLLERAASMRDRRLLYSNVIPFLTNLRGSPRFTALLRQMQLV